MTDKKDEKEKIDCHIQLGTLFSKSKNIMILKIRIVVKKKPRRMKKIIEGKLGSNKKRDIV